MEYGKPFLRDISTFNYLRGYLVENPIQTLIIRCHNVFLVWFIKRAWAACGFDSTVEATLKDYVNHNSQDFVASAYFGLVSL